MTGIKMHTKVITSFNYT